jgi:hypothetical protein
MKFNFIFFVLVVFLFSACGGKPSAPEKSEPRSGPKVLLEKAETEREEPLPPEVKIKLKRDGRNSYSWELNGSDVDEILKVNEKLRKTLSEGPSR